jgi:PAS domain S-box-containing protein
VERDVWLEAGEYIYDDQQNITAVSGILQDITEKKAAERELRKSEDLLQRIYDLLPVGLWITDNTGRLVRSNKMVTEIWGKDILVGIDEFNIFRGRRLPSREEIQPDDWASVHTIKEGVTIKDEMVEIDAYDGKTKTILNYSTPILGENGALEGSIILNLDITELKHAEEQLSAQLDELRRWNLATLGRENRIRELKVEINELLVVQGLSPKYQSVMDDGHE